MSRQEMLDAIDRFICDGISLDDVAEELCYRKNAAADMKWNDYLYEYSTDELQAIEMGWEEMNKRARK